MALYNSPEYDNASFENCFMEGAEPLTQEHEDKLLWSVEPQLK